MLTSELAPIEGLVGETRPERSTRSERMPEAPTAPLTASSAVLCVPNVIKSPSWER